MNPWVDFSGDILNLGTGDSVLRMVFLSRRSLQSLSLSTHTHTHTSTEFELRQSNAAIFHDGNRNRDLARIEPELRAGHPNHAQIRIRQKKDLRLAELLLLTMVINSIWIVTGTRMYICEVIRAALADTT
jgi:hypothetical protein